MSNELKVFYPYGGTHFILHYWTYNDRGHIILARSEEKITELANNIFEKHSDAEIKAYLEVNIVAPSNLMHNLNKAFILKESIEYFHREVCSRLNEFVKSGKKLPPQFELCSSFQPKHSEDSIDDWDRDNHFECKNCTDKIKLVNMDEVEFYNKYHEAWRKIYPSSFDYSHPNLLLSRAEEQATDEEELYFADAGNFGHHSSGIDVNSFDQKEPCKYVPNWLRGYAIFFFRKVREIDTSSLQKLLDGHKKLFQERKEKQEKEWIEKEERDEEEKIEKTLRFFEENK